MTEIIEAELSRIVGAVNLHSFALGRIEAQLELMVGNLSAMRAKWNECTTSIIVMPEGTPDEVIVKMYQVIATTPERCSSVNSGRCRLDVMDENDKDHCDCWARAVALGKLFDRMKAG